MYKGPALRRRPGPSSTTRRENVRAGGLPRLSETSSAWLQTWEELEACLEEKRVGLGQRRVRKGSYVRCPLRPRPRGDAALGGYVGLAAPSCWRDGRSAKCYPGCWV